MLWGSEERLRERLEAELRQAAERFDAAGDGTLVLRMDYLEAVITKLASAGVGWRRPAPGR